MKQEDIIRMAREAWGEHHEIFWFDDDGIERFAALVEEAATEAANARANTSWSLMCKKMVAAENEACAKVAEEWLGPTKDRELHIAAAIRARGQA
jgi:hypothetical protein